MNRRKSNQARSHLHANYPRLYLSARVVIALAADSNILGKIRITNEIASEDKLSTTGVWALDSGLLPVPLKPDISYHTVCTFP